VREFRIAAGVSAHSQVSVKVRISRELSRMKSCRISGLWSSEVIEDADLMFRVTKKILRGVHGPGLGSMSPEIRREK